MRRSSLIPHLSPRSYVVRYRMRPGQDVSILVVASSLQNATEKGFIEAMELRDADETPRLLSCEPLNRRTLPSLGDPAVFLALVAAIFISLAVVIVAMADLPKSYELPKGPGGHSAELFPEAKP